MQSHGFCNFRGFLFVRAVSVLYLAGCGSALCHGPLNGPLVIELVCWSAVGVGKDRLVSRTHTRALTKLPNMRKGQRAVAHSTHCLLYSVLPYRRLSAASRFDPTQPLAGTEGTRLGKEPDWLCCTGRGKFAKAISSHAQQYYIKCKKADNRAHGTRPTRNPPSSMTVTHQVLPIQPHRPAPTGRSLVGTKGAGNHFRSPKHK